MSHAERMAKGAKREQDRLYRARIDAAMEKNAKSISEQNKAQKLEVKKARIERRQEKAAALYDTLREQVPAFLEEQGIENPFVLASDDKLIPDTLVFGWSSKMDHRGNAEFRGIAFTAHRPGGKFDGDEVKGVGLIRAGTPIYNTGDEFDSRPPRVAPDIYDFRLFLKSPRAMFSRLAKDIGAAIQSPAGFRMERSNRSSDGAPYAIKLKADQVGGVELFKQYRLPEVLAAS